MFKCLCCGKETMKERYNYEICPYCGWEDDPVQGDDETYWGGANELSLKDCRALVLCGKNLVDDTGLPWDKEYK